ncbi:MAG: hypothetical protein E7331_05885 [Clostridiales bacterium]|nr:hypothetical protein [Clostridiales bacterium]
MKKISVLLLVLCLFILPFVSAYASGDVFFTYGPIRIFFPEGTKQLSNISFTTPGGSTVFIERGFSAEFLSFEEFLGPEAFLEAMLSGIEDVTVLRLSTTESGVGVCRAVGKVLNMG